MTRFGSPTPSPVPSYGMLKLRFLNIFHLAIRLFTSMAINNNMIKVPLLFNIIISLPLISFPFKTILLFYYTYIYRNVFLYFFFRLNFYRAWKRNGKKIEILLWKIVQSWKCMAKRKIAHIHAPIKFEPVLRASNNDRSKIKIDDAKQRPNIPYIARVQVESSVSNLNFALSMSLNLLIIHTQRVV